MQDDDGRFAAAAALGPKARKNSVTSPDRTVPVRRNGSSMAVAFPQFNEPESSIGPSQHET
jgi:hypothetical protein